LKSQNSICDRLNRQTIVDQELNYISGSALHLPLYLDASILDK